MDLDHLLQTLLNLSRECEWVEFKVDNEAPEEIGEYVSALSNSAALHGEEAGYLVWGVEDRTRRLVGTSVQPRDRRIGNEELEHWIAHNLTPRIDFRFEEWKSGGLRFVLLRIDRAAGSPVAFKGVEWIRVGGVKTKLKTHSGKEQELWRLLSGHRFEQAAAASDVSGDEVLAVLDYPKYFDLVGLSLPASRVGVLDRLGVERLIARTGTDRYTITNLGAVLFAKHLTRFGTVGRKALRLVRYKGVSRVDTEHEKLFPAGYAAGFEGMIDYITGLSPRNEVMARALRRDVRMYPERAVRELVANALVHQEFSLSGTGPMVELFDDRLEVSNPGLPLIDPLRFIDHSPRSRNEVLADVMRRLGICEERGSGFDKVIFEVEFHQLPAPDIRTDTTHTRVVLFAHRDLKRMDRIDRVRACYQHCCLLYVSNRVMTNTTLRERFGLEESGYTIASRIIREAVTEQLVKPEDSTTRSRKYARYIPFWA